MFRELVAGAARFADDGRLLPVAYKEKVINWIVQIDETGTGSLVGPFRAREVRKVAGPDRQRSGRIGEDNLKPYLLVDDCRYVFGIPDPGREDDARLAHEEFKRVLTLACKATGDDDLARIATFLSRSLPEEMGHLLQPRDVVSFRCGADFPTEKQAVQVFWARFLSEELLANIVASCAVCGVKGEIVRILPMEISVMGQKCQMVSFNQTAFTSFGKEQTANAPLCFDCASKAAQVLNYFLHDAKHNSPLVRDEGRGQNNPLRNQLAVFWLREAQRIQHDEVEIDLESLLGGPLRPEELRAATEIAPELAQLDELLRAPLSGRESAFRLADDAFYLGVLSANKGRLVAREWMTGSVGDLRKSLGAFLAASRIVGLQGEKARPFGIPCLLQAVGACNPNLTRGLLRTAYIGLPPPAGLIEPALHQFRNPKKRSERRLVHVLAAALKLAITHGNKEEAEAMERLDRSRGVPAYLCGRLLAVLEETQQRASNWRLNVTMVDRFYGSAAATPAATFSGLIRLSQTAHLPKLRRENRGHNRMQLLMEEVISGLDEGGGFPHVLSPLDQAEFALGFYHQKAAFRSERSGESN